MNVKTPAKNAPKKDDTISDEIEKQDLIIGKINVNHMKMSYLG